MINLTRTNLQNAIQRAKQVHPKVIWMGDRNFMVTGSKGACYVVKFVVKNGQKLGSCTCAAGQNNQPCFHLVSAAVLNIAIQSMKKRVAEQAPSPAEASDSKYRTLDQLNESQLRQVAVQFSATRLCGRQFEDYVYELTNDGRVLCRKDKRESLIAEITTKWQARWPNYRIADTLMKEYGRNSLALMPTGYLQDILQVWFPAAA